MVTTTWNYKPLLSDETRAQVEWMIGRVSADSSKAIEDTLAAYDNANAELEAANLSCSKEHMHTQALADRVAELEAQVAATEADAFGFAARVVQLERLRVGLREDIIGWYIQSAQNICSMGEEQDAKDAEEYADALIARLENGDG